MQAEMSFYGGNDQEAELILKGLKAKKDRNIALWSNQLGSLYLADGRNQEAKAEFMDAYLVMNNVTAFKDLEAQAVGLMGDEATKAYKGDPYEKVFNSFYLGMLFYSENDLENALACFRNGILCDSDVEGSLYKSDAALLYLMAARVEALQKDQSMSDDFLKQANEAFYLSYPDNRQFVSQEQEYVDAMSKKQKMLAEKEAPYNATDPEKVKKMSADAEKEINGLKADISKLEGDVKSVTDKIQQNNQDISTDLLKDFANSDNNTLLCLETGRGPLKYQVGRYGEKAVFTEKPYRATSFNINVDNNYKVEAGRVLKNNDILYQANTRGGRVMDGILKGKAEFKQTTADVADMFSTMSQVYDPYGIFSLFSLASSAVSDATNSYADSRHWSLLPAEIQIVPLKLSPGAHQLVIDACDASGAAVSSYKIDVDIKDSPNNVIFQRVR